MASDGGTLGTAASEPVTPPLERRIRLTIGPTAWTLAFVAVVAALVLTDVATRARRPLGWALAAVVAAAALELPIDALTQRIKRRGLALIIVVVPLLAAVGTVTWAVVDDLDDQVRRLQRDIPAVAAEIEASERFGEVARDFGLLDEARELAEGLRRPSSSVGEEARSGASTWLLTLVLTIFGVLWGRRLTDAGLAQIGDEARRRRVARISRRAFDRSQRYVVASLVLGAATGAVAWLCFRFADLPAPIPLALMVAVASLVPLIGVTFSMWCAAGLAAGLESAGAGLAIAGMAVLVQAAHMWLLRRATGSAPRPGPAIIVVSFLIGWNLYGVGGVVVGTALMVYAVAILDAIREDDADGTDRAAAAG